MFCFILKLGYKKSASFKDALPGSLTFLNYFIITFWVFKTPELFCNSII